MDDLARATLHLRQKERIRSFSVGKPELNRLLDLLQERSSAAAELEISRWVKPEIKTDEEFEADKIKVRDGFILRPTVTGIDGRELFGTVSELFASPNFPDEVGRLYVNTEIPLKSKYSYQPANSFQLFLDFGKPAIFNFSIMPSSETANESSFSVDGRDATWVNGVFSEVVKFIMQRSSTHSWIHRHSAYDLLLWLIGYPIAFWLCLKAAPLISLLVGSSSEFLRAAAYFYVFIISIFTFRILFHYARWIWPLVEYRSEHNKTLQHRATLGIILAGVIFIFRLRHCKMVFWVSYHLISEHTVIHGDQKK
jgi:hypothetical protein